jgi:hypothetical protein
VLGSFDYGAKKESLTKKRLSTRPFFGWLGGVVVPRESPTKERKTLIDAYF